MKKEKKQKIRKIRIAFAPSVFKKFPKLQVLFLLAENVDNQTKLKESQEMVKDIASLVRQTFHPDTVKTHHLISPWAVARQEFGNRAKHYCTSVEKLLEKTMQGERIAGENVVSNIVNFISLKHFVPLAVDDAKKIEGKVIFGIADGKEKTFQKTLQKKLQKGDIFYADENNILGTKLDFWKNTRTQPTAQTKKVLIHFEILPPLKMDKVKEITAELAHLLEDFCGGKIKGAIVSKKKTQTVL